MMTIIVGIGVLAVGLLTLICCAALLEMFQQLEQVRTILRIDDTARPLELQRPGVAASEIGLPDVFSHVPEAIVVFLSAKCATCRSVAHAFRGGAPDRVWFVLEASPEDDNGMGKALSAAKSRLIWDDSNELAKAIGIDVTPSVVVIQFGQLRKAFAVASARQVFSLMPTNVPAELLHGRMDDADGRPEGETHGRDHSAAAAAAAARRHSEDVAVEA